MKNVLKMFPAIMLAVLLVSVANAQTTWPLSFSTNDGSSVTIYQPQPESFSGNTLKFRAAISTRANENEDPVFGTFWCVSNVSTDRDSRTAHILSAQVPNLKFTNDTLKDKSRYYKTALESNLPALDANLSQDYIVASLEKHGEEKKLSKDLNNEAPPIYFATKPTVLVLIDGQPKLQANKDWGVDVVVNSAFTIVKSDGNFYLYGGGHWFSAPAATGPYVATKTVNPSFSKIEDAINSASNSEAGYGGATQNPQTVDENSDIIVSNTPAELLQSKGNPTFAPIDNTTLTYISNSDNDIFKCDSDGYYYALLSGRWYKSQSLERGWGFVPTNQLPSDFSKIPEGSPKDNVLASISGTKAANEAVIDAQIPQVAKVDRNQATTSVSYDGQPQFAPIEGTSMQYAVNTPNSVISYRGAYYCVDNGIWFESGFPNGPWRICTYRPEEVEIIPASCPVYNMKYVYIYDVQPDFVYVGYTPGYLNTFICGPTVVYGTGYYYRPWRGVYYYPRVCTWGYSMHYNPWLGWSMGYHYCHGWLNIGFGGPVWNRGWYGGWWGPSCYHPPYRVFLPNHSGYYGVHNFVRNRDYFRNDARVNVNVNYHQNIYNVNKYVINDNRGPLNSGRPPINRTNNSPTNTGGGPYGGKHKIELGGPNNVITDKQGGVYKKDNGGNWTQHQNNGWHPLPEAARPTISSNLNHQQENIDRGQERAQRYQEYAPRPQQQTQNSRPAQQSRPSNNGGGRQGNGGGRKR